jgi:homoserine O-succinyltransferase/O-acetyltransferase
MLRAALLDMYNGEDNRGIPMLKALLNRFSNDFSFDHLDIRVRNEVPGLEYDIYIFSGGPGDPLEHDKPWCDPFYALIETLWEHNKNAELLGKSKKYVFFICHSFQIACHTFKLGRVTERRQMSFGTYPVHKTYYGKIEPLFNDLHDPFYIADFRRYQVVEPNRARFGEMGASLLCLEKLRPHVHDERAMMAIRFSPEMIGTQFHPEADPEGMMAHFLKPERRAAIEQEHGHTRYERMMRDLSHPFKIQLTFDTIIPGFLKESVAALKKEKEFANLSNFAAL